MKRIVLDTSVLVSAFRSRLGASFRLVRELVEKPRFQIAISVPLILEYESALRRKTDLTERDVDEVLNFLCEVGDRREIYFLWRPFLRDPRDEMVLEVAVESRAGSIVTHNIRDFAGVEDKFSIAIRTPGEFLVYLEEE